MNVYQKVLLKLYQVTGGKDSATVDLKDLVKGMGFLGSYEDIYQILNGQGWIVETPKLNFVKISHWGVKEANKSNENVGNQPDAAQAVKREAAKLVAETKLFVIMLEEFAANASKENFGQIESKANEINQAVGKLKSGIQ